MSFNSNRLTWSDPISHFAVVLIAILITAGLAFAAGTARLKTAVPVYTNTDVVLLVSYILMALIFSLMMTLMILFLSEIIPKTLGAVFWRKLTWATMIFISILVIALYPLIWISERLTKLIARSKEINVFCRDEFAAMAKIVEEAGHMRKRESRIIHNLLRFESIKANDIMTPRTVLVGLQQDLTVSEAMDLELISAFSRILLFGESLDDITGFILKTEMLISKAQDRKEIKLVTFKRNVMKNGILLGYKVRFKRLKSYLTGM